MSQKLSLLMPCYNESAYLEKIVDCVLQAPSLGLEKELVMVDDCSKDNSWEILQTLQQKFPEQIRIFKQEVNAGKGAAIRRAIQEMTGDIAIIQDCDLEYDPNEYPILLGPIVNGRADVVYGSRFLTSSARRVLNYHHYLGNQFLTHLSNFTSGLNLTDMETCYKVFKAPILKSMTLKSNRFGIEPEFTIKIAKRKCIVYEVSISYHGRTYAEGKKIGWKDGVSAIYSIFRFAFWDKE